MTLGEYDKAPDADEDRGQSFEAACAQDLITRIRNIVTSIQYSWQRHDALAIWIETRNKSGLFVLNGKPVQIQAKQLLRDVPTRWESTYQMIKRCLEMHLVSLTFFSMIPMSKLFTLGNRHLSLTTRKRSRVFSVDEEGLGCTSRLTSRLSSSLAPFSCNRFFIHTTKLYRPILNFDFKMIILHEINDRSLSLAGLLGVLAASAGVSSLYLITAQQHIKASQPHLGPVRW